MAVTSQQQYVRDARRAARDLAAAVNRLDASAARSTDLSRLADEVARIGQQLVELAGGTSPRAPRAGESREQPLDLSYDPRQVSDTAADLPSRHQHG